MADVSPRLAAIVDALPLRPGMRVLEIGGAPGAAARVVAARIGDGHILVIDRSAKGVALTRRNAQSEIDAGRLSVRQAAAEEFELMPGEAPYDLAFAVRVGALDGRHPAAGRRARRRISDALTPEGRLFIDGGDPLREVVLATRSVRLLEGAIEKQNEPVTLAEMEHAIGEGAGEGTDT